MEVDFGRTAADYARHRAGFPEELFKRLAARGIGRAGQRVLDLGSGIGSLAPEAVAAFDRALATRLATGFPGAPLQVPHRCFALTARRPEMHRDPDQ
ncbi:MAG: hypothetical protein IID48_14120 [Proteobacteria bacterium]|nr:hypothetical protein [Pseudomonadota bacterium]